MTPLLIPIFILVLIVLGWVFHIWINLFIFLVIIMILIFGWIILLHLKKGYVGPALLLGLSLLLICLFYKTGLRDFLLYKYIIDYFNKYPTIWRMSIYSFLAVLSILIGLVVLFLMNRLFKKSLSIIDSNKYS